jgi:hypothetical protein
MTSPLRLCLAARVSAGIAVETPRRGELSPRWGDLPIVTKKRILMDRCWIRSSPVPVYPRVYPPSSSHTGDGELPSRGDASATSLAAPEASPVGVLDRQTYQGGTRGSRLCGGDRDRETENSKVCARTRDTRFIQVRVAMVANPTSCWGDQVWRPALGVVLSPEGLGMCG